MSRWDEVERPPYPTMGAAHWLLAGLRVSAIAVVIFGFMIPMILLRVIGINQWAQWVVQIACRLVLIVIGLKVARDGTPMVEHGGVVANHSSWLDIFVLNAVQRAVFVSKSEVAKWPLIGLIARSVGTVFIERKQSHAAKQKDVFGAQIKAGNKLLFFPEGTSTDGRRVLSFKPTLFAAFFDAGVQKDLWIQPVSVVYTAPPRRDDLFYGWWGDADFFSHFFIVLGQFRQGHVTVKFHPAVPVSKVSDRKVMARETGAAVRAGLVDTLNIR